MKLVSYIYEKKIGIGALKEGQVIPFSNNSNIPNDMLTFIEAGESSLDMARDVIEKNKNGILLNDCKLINPILRPPKILAIGLNYQDHLEEIRLLGRKVDDPEENLKLTTLAWETDGVRSVRNDVKIKEKFNFKQSAKDLLITSQLRAALIINKKIKATNYQIDTYKKKVYVYGIAITSDEKDLVLKEANEILDVENVIASIILVDNLRIQKN